MSKTQRIKPRTWPIPSSHAKCVGSPTGTIAPPTVPSKPSGARATYEYYRVGIYEGAKLVAVSVATSNLEQQLDLKHQVRGELRDGQRAMLLLCETDPNPDYTLRPCTARTW